MHRIRWWQYLGWSKTPQAEENIPFAHVLCFSFWQQHQPGWGFPNSCLQWGYNQFSHINYHSLSILVSSELGTLIVRLIPKDYLLDDVVINTLPAEEEFKKQVMQTEIVSSKEKSNADVNRVNSKKLFLSGYVPEMNSEGKYKQYIRGTQGVSIFSGDPSKGLAKSFKNILRHNKPFPILKYRSAYSYWFTLTKLQVQTGYNSTKRNTW